MFSTKNNNNVKPPFFGWFSPTLNSKTFGEKAKKYGIKHSASFGVLEENKQTAIFTKQKKIAKGTFGCVYKIVDKRSGVEAALKQQEYENETHYKLVSSENALSNSVNGNTYLFNAISSQNKEYAYLYMTLLSPDLDKILLNRHYGYKPDITYFGDFLKFIYIPVLKMTQSLHKIFGIIHDDIKLLNICCDESMNLSFCDFGLAGKLIESKDNPLPQLSYGYWNAECWYLPGELADKIFFTPSIDVYSLGKLLYEINTNHDLFKKIILSDGMGIKPFYSRMIDVNPEKRPSVEDSIKYFVDYYNLYNKDTAKKKISYYWQESLHIPLANLVAREKQKAFIGIEKLKQQETSGSPRMHALKKLSTQIEDSCVIDDIKQEMQQFKELDATLIATKLAGRHKDDVYENYAISPGCTKTILSGLIPNIKVSHREKVEMTLIDFIKEGNIKKIELFIKKKDPVFFTKTSADLLGEMWLKTIETNNRNKITEVFNLIKLIPHDALKRRVFSRKNAHGALPLVAEIYTKAFCNKKSVEEIALNKIVELLYSHLLSEFYKYYFEKIGEIIAFFDGGNLLNSSYPDSRTATRTGAKIIIDELNALFTIQTQLVPSKNYDLGSIKTEKDRLLDIFDTINNYPKNARELLFSFTFPATGKSFLKTMEALKPSLSEAKKTPETSKPKMKMG